MSEKKGPSRFTRMRVHLNRDHHDYSLSNFLLSLFPNPICCRNTFLSWVAAYAQVHNQSDCWVCGLLPPSNVKGIPWIIHPFNLSDWERSLDQVTTARSGPLSPSSHSGEPSFDYKKTKEYTSDLIQK